MARHQVRKGFKTISFTLNEEVIKFLDNVTKVLNKNHPVTGKKWTKSDVITMLVTKSVTDFKKGEEIKNA